MKKIKLILVLVFAVSGLMFKFFGSTPTAKSQTTLGAPTGLTATVNRYNNKVGLQWDTIRGATSYRIFRHTINEPSTATPIGVTALPYFFDTTAVAGQTYFYWVQSENGNTVSGFSQPANGMRAIGTNNGPVSPLEPPPPAPLSNPLTAAKAYLGKTLFWDEQLSSTKTVACGTCHQAAAGGSDPRSLVNNFNARNPGFDQIFNTADDVIGSPGVPQNNADGTYNFSNTYGFREQVTARKANSHINAVYAPLLFWDGRASGTFRDPLTNAILINNGGALESQAVGPPVNDVEMSHFGNNWSNVANQIAQAKPLALATNIPSALQNWIGGRTYPELFQEAFGTPEVTPARIAMALASYQRTLFSDQAPIDLADAGIQPLPPAEQRGRNVFLNTQCTACHSGSLLTDNTFRNIGLRPVFEDTGRFQVTGNNGDLGEFRTPALRNVGLRSSFMHNGRLVTLEEVVEFYSRGGDFRNEPNFPSQLIQPRNLSPQQKADLATFLRNSLTDVRVRDELPPFDRPRLYTESNRVPLVSGTGRNGSGGILPQMIAIEPPLVGNPSFTVAVRDGLGGAQATLVIDSSDPGVGSSIPVGGSLWRQSIYLQGSGVGNGYGSVSVVIPNNAGLVGQTFYGRWYISDAGAANGFSVSRLLQFTVFGENFATRPTFADFDGDRRTDLSIFRVSNGQWWYLRSIDSANRVYQFGVGTDRIVPADYTGDGRTDVAVWRESTGEWFILRSEDSSYVSVPFGASGDVPAPGDYDGDGKADLGIYRQGTWYIQKSSGGVDIFQFGLSGDVPQVGDYDGDGRTDVAIYRPGNGQWWIRRTNLGVMAVQFGVASDRPVAQDYTGDGKVDVAFYRPASGEWYVLRSEDLSYYAVQFGVATDEPVIGDYDGDGMADIGVFRQGTWYVNRTTQGLLIAGFGQNGDKPVPAAFIP